MASPKTSYESTYSTWKEATLGNRSQLYRSIADCTNQLRQQSVEPVAEIPASKLVGRKQVVRFSDGSIDIRVRDAIDLRISKRRVIAILGAQSIERLWSTLTTSSRNPPEALVSGAKVIVKTLEDPDHTQVALTTPLVPDRDHPEHEYMRPNPGTLIKAQQSYPLRHSVLVDVKADFYETTSNQVRPDIMLAGAVRLTQDMLVQAGSMIDDTATTGPAGRLIEAGQVEAINGILDF